MEFIKKRLEENKKFFTEEEYEFILQNELFVTKVYILGYRFTIDMSHAI